MKKKSKIGCIIVIAVLGILASMAILRWVSYDSKQSMKAPTKTKKVSPLDRLSVKTRFEVDQILESMMPGNIVFNTPQSMNLYDTESIQLLLSITKSIDDLKLKVEAVGKKEGAQIRVSDRMEARLIGENFTIATITPLIQAVSKKEITQWKWEITPKSPGTQYLNLALSAYVRIDGEPTPRLIKIFQKEIVVQVTQIQRVKYCIENNKWLWEAIIAILVGITGAILGVYLERLTKKDKQHKRRQNKPRG